MASEVRPRRAGGPAMPLTLAFMAVSADWVHHGRVGHGADRRGAGWSSGVAVGAAAFAGAGRGAAGPAGDEVGGPDQLGGEVGQGAGQRRRGERAARVRESWAAWMARLKLTRPGSRPGGAACAIRSRTAW